MCYRIIASPYELLPQLPDGETLFGGHCTAPWNGTRMPDLSVEGSPMIKGKSLARGFGRADCALCDEAFHGLTTAGVAHGTARLCRTASPAGDAIV